MNSKNSQGQPARMIPITISTIIFFLLLLLTAPVSHGEEPFFSIALSKFSDEDAAKKEESKLKSSGNNAFYRKEKNPGNGNIEYQVYIEKYKSMEEAIKEAKVLKELEIISDYLVKEVVDTPIVEEPPPETPPEGSETPQPASDIKQGSEVKTGVAENKAPAPDSKKVEVQAPLTTKKDVEEKIPSSETKKPVKAAVETEPQKVESPLQPVDKKEEGKNAPEAAPKAQIEKPTAPEQKTSSVQNKKEPVPIQKEAVKQSPLPVKHEEQAQTTDKKIGNESAIKPEITAPQKQEKSSGQIRREPIPVQKETVKQATVSDKTEEQMSSSGQKAVKGSILNPENIEPQKQIPEPKSEKYAEQKTSAEPVTVEKTAPKQAPPEIISDVTIPAKANTAVAQTPDNKRAEPEKVPEKNTLSTDVNIDQAKGATLQVGACKEEANAAILKKQLLSLGRTAFYRHEATSGIGDVYRIYITGYKTLGEAVKDAKTLVSSGVITGYARPQSKIPATDIPPKKADAAATETDGKIYFIHTGSYKEEVNAQRAVASLKESGYKAFYVPEKEPSFTWFRVYIGDFRSEAQAREKGMELLNKGVITYFKPVAIAPEEKVTD